MDRVGKFKRQLLQVINGADYSASLETPRGTLTIDIYIVVL